MNRRDFIRASATALLGFTILPGAGRVWKARRDVRWIVNPAWVNAPFEMVFIWSPRRYPAVQGCGEIVFDDPWPCRFNECVDLSSGWDEISEKMVPRFIAAPA